MDISKAIKAINPTAEFGYSDEDFSTLKWLNGTTPISQADIEAKQVELRADFDAKQYQRDRAIAYKELKEQLDLLYHDMVADKGDKTGEWFKHIKAVKDANPKE